MEAAQDAADPALPVRELLDRLVGLGDAGRDRVDGQAAAEVEPVGRRPAGVEADLLGDEAPAVAAAERARGGATYSLGGENLPQMRIFEAIESMTGRRKPMRIPASIANALGALEEYRARVFGASPLVTRGAVEIFRYDWPLDSSAAARELGYRVRPLVEGIDLLLKSRRVEGSGDR